jgi:hypothetical protein
MSDATMTTYSTLHRLWTRAVGTPDYDKREWQAFERALRAAGAIPAVKTGALAEEGPRPGPPPEPCAGGCGSLAPLAAGWMCSPCCEGARILNKNALRLARKEAPAAEVSAEPPTEKEPT